MLSSDYSEQKNYFKKISEQVEESDSIYIDSLLQPAIASKVLRICLVGFCLTKAEIGISRTACRVYMDFVRNPIPQTLKAEKEALNVGTLRTS